MGFLQVLLLAALGAWLVRSLRPPVFGPVAWAWVPPIAILALAIVQIEIEGWRWPLAPAYFLACFLACAGGVRLIPLRCPPRLAFFGALGGLALLGASVCLSVLAALMWLPAPNGPHPVGVTTLKIPIQSDPDARLPAFLKIQVWYPAATGGRPAPYGVSEGLAGLRRRLFQTHASSDAAPAAATAALPLIVYVPGWLGTRVDNTVVAEALASHGFVVAGFDDIGRMVPSGDPFSRLMDFSSAAGFQRTLELAGRKVALEARLASGVVDAMLAGGATGADGHPRPPIDPARVAILGYSFGGAVAVESCRRDPRFRAAMNMDGWLFGPAAAEGIAQPYFLASDQSELPPEGTVVEEDKNPFVAALNRDDDRRQRAVLWRAGGFVLRIDDVAHADFTDDPFFSPRRLTGRQSIDPVRVSGVISAYAMAFFGAVLNGSQPGFTLDEGPAGRIATLQIWPAAHAR